MRLRLDKTTVSLFTVLLFLIVNFNTELNQISVLHTGSIALCFVVLLWQFMPTAKLHQYHIWRVIYILWAVLSYFLQSSQLGVGRNYMLDIILQSLVLFLVCILVYQGYFKELVTVYVCATFFTVAYVMIEAGSSQFFTQQLGSLILGNSRWNGNEIGVWASTAFVLILIRNKIDSAGFLGRKSVKWIMLVVLAVATVWTGSRTGLLLFVMGVAGYFILTGETQSTKARNVLIVILGLFLLYYILMNNPTLYSLIGVRMERLFSFIQTKEITEISMDRRNSMIHYAWQLFKEHPLFGVGINGFNAYYGASSGFYTYSHNNFVELLSDGGIVGFVIYYSIYIKAFLCHKTSTVEYKKLLLMFLFIIVLIDYSTISYMSLKIQYLVCILASQMLYTSEYSRAEVVYGE